MSGVAKRKSLYRQIKSYRLTNTKKLFGIRNTDKEKFYDRDYSINASSKGAVASYFWMIRSLAATRVVTLPTNGSNINSP
jgi:hypothetical protein